MILNEFQNKIRNLDKSNVYLHFITRVPKEGVNPRAKVRDKYDFNIYKVQVDDDTREYLLELTKEQIDKAVVKNLDLVPYEVISDDTEKIFTYQTKNKIGSFVDVITNKLANQSKILFIKDFEKFADEDNNERFWAYCIGFDVRGEWYYTFRKIKPSKISMEESKANPSLYKHLLINPKQAIFNSKSQQLELVDNFIIHFDKQIDCLYSDETFYSLNKAEFETIVGIEDEMKEQSHQTVIEIEGCNLLADVEIIRTEIESNPAIHRKLVRVNKIGLYKNLTCDSIGRMQEVATLLGGELIVKDDKIVLGNAKDIDLLIRILCEYLKVGKISGNTYGTYAGKIINN